MRLFLPLVFAVGCLDFLDKADDDPDEDDWAEPETPDAPASNGGAGGGSAADGTDPGDDAVDDTAMPADDTDADESGDVIDMPGDACDGGTGIRDCSLDCWVAASLNYLGDGICDAGARGPNFDCVALNFDEGDCIEDSGSAPDGGEGTEADAGSDSCSFGESICVEPNEPDNEAWCASLGSWAVYFETPCPEGFYGTCAIPVGGDYTAAATAFYYGEGLDGESACAALGGTYTGS